MKNIKILIVIVLILSMAAFGITFFLYTTRENEKEKRLLAEEENITLVEQNEQFAQSLASLREQEKILKEKVLELTKTRNSLQQKQNSIENERDKAIASLSKVQEQLDEAKQDFSNYKVKTAEIVSDFKDQNQKLQEKVQQLTQQLNQRSVGGGQAGGVLQPSISPDGTNVQLPQVVVKPQDVKTGKVIVVNRKYNFFITNLGSSDNISLGNQVAVFRNNQLVATGKVEKVYDKLSACGILSMREGTFVEESDIVKVQ